MNMSGKRERGMFTKLKKYERWKHWRGEKRKGDVWQARGGEKGTEDVRPSHAAERRWTSKPRPAESYLWEYSSTFLLLGQLAFLWYEDKHRRTTLYYWGTNVLAPTLLTGCLNCCKYIFLTLLHCCTYCKSLWMCASVKWQKATVKINYCIQVTSVKHIIHNR